MIAFIIRLSAMRLRLALWVLLVASRSTAAQEDLTSEFAHLLRQQYAAMARHDTASLRPRLANGLSWVLGANGAQISKTQLLDAVARPSAATAEYGIDSVRVVRIGSVALVDYRRTDTFRIGATIISTQWRALDAYAARSERWQLERHTQAHLVRESPRVSLDSAVLTAFVGRYQVGPGNVDVVTLKAGRLFTQNSIERVAPELVPVSSTAFRPNGVGALLVFERDASGAVIGYVQAFPDGRVARAPRIQ